jgi:hypothetical protein
MTINNALSAVFCSLARLVVRILSALLFVHEILPILFLYVSLCGLRQIRKYVGPRQQECNIASVPKERSVALPHRSCTDLRLQWFSTGTH